MYSDAAVIMAAAVYCGVEDKSAQGIYCESLIQNQGQEKHLLLLSEKCAVYPRLLKLIEIIVEGQKSFAKIELDGLIAKLIQEQSDGAREFELIYKWLGKVSSVEDRAKELLNLIQKAFSPKDPLLDLHRENVVKIAADYSAYCKQGECEISFVKWLTAVLVKADLNNNLRRELFETYAIDLYRFRTQNVDVCFETNAELITDIQEPGDGEI